MQEKKDQDENYCAICKVEPVLPRNFAIATTELPGSILAYDFPDEDEDDDSDYSTESEEQSDDSDYSTESEYSGVSDLE